MQAIECFVCCGNNFTVIDGAFVCNECGIQSQSFREEHITFNDNIFNMNHDEMADKDHEMTTGSQLKKGKKLLSWECFNLILLGLTNEIIELGARPSLKVIVLQLWARYLQCIEAAFTSKKYKKLPKLYTSINNMDCEILYGVQNLKNKLLHARTGLKLGNKKNKPTAKRSLKSSVSSAMTGRQKRFRVTSNLRRIEKSEKGSNNESTGLSDDVSLLQRSKKSSKVKIKLSKNVKKSLSSMPSVTENTTFEESSNLLKSGEKYWKKLKYKERKNLLTIKKLISIIQLAFMINQDDIYLSDLLRWIREGHLHVNRVNLFLPENVQHGVQFVNMARISSRNSQNLELSMLLNHLETNQLPNIDFEKLVIRFCDELQLPSDFTSFVCKLVLISSPEVEFNRIVPDIEVKIMSYILFAAKFIFCLDGIAENLSSNFAENVNQSKKINKILFNWNDYVQYIECRNSVLSEYNYLLRKDLYGNSVKKTQLFINDWNTMKSTLPIIEKEKLSKYFRNNTECLLKMLPNIGENKSYREIPASTKPLSSTLKWIFEYYQKQLHVEAKQILAKDFTQTDILYLTDEIRLHDLANECNIPIEINRNKPFHYAKRQRNDPDTKCFPSHTAKIKVNLIDQPLNNVKQNEVLNNLPEEKPNTIYLGTGFNYWIIHMNKQFLKRADISKIQIVLNKQLPHSFLWFMNQCCTILNCQQSDMYLELISLENKLLTFLQKNETKDLTECEDLFSNITL